MERETIKLTVSELSDVVFGDSEVYDVVESSITGTFRHGNENEAIVKRVSDGKFFAIHYRDSVKDTCDFQDLNYDDTYREVFPKEKTVVYYA